MTFKKYIMIFGVKLAIRQRQLNFLLYGQLGESYQVSQSVGKTIIILSFRVGTSNNKNIDHRVKETCSIMSTQVTEGTDHISVLCHSTMSTALNICFLCILL